MRKPIILFPLLFLFAFNVYAQPVERYSYCYEFPEPGPLRFIACECIWTVEGRFCWDYTKVYNKSGVVVTKVDFYVAGIAEVDGETIPFETKPWRTVFVNPNERMQVEISHRIRSQLFNLKLLVSVYTSVTKDGDVIVDTGHTMWECYVYPDD
jgi:hypothetical protein